MLRGLISCFLVCFLRWENFLVFTCFIVLLYLISFLGVSSIYNISWIFEVDYIRACLILLRLWIICLSVISAREIKFKPIKKKNFLFFTGSLLYFLILRFSCSSFLFFFIRFECRLIPIFILILGWGYQPDRYMASIYILFYTFLGSLPLFFVILYNYSTLGTNYMFNSLYTSVFFSPFLFFFVFIGFLIKFPIYGVHLWLLKAHVEAPVRGSIILAGVLLKLGGFGIIRFLNIYDKLPTFFTELIVITRLWGGLIVSFSCIRQLDIKLLVARSSVVHIRLCIRSLFILRGYGLKGVVIVILGHGLCRSGLFYIVNCVYTRTNSRRLLVNKGILNLIPNISLWWFLMVSINMAAPPSINLLGEINLIISLINWDLVSYFILIVISFFSAGFSLYLYSISQHGFYFFTKSSFNSGLLLEYFILILHFTPLNLLILVRFILIYFNSLYIKILYCGYKELN